MTMKKCIACTSIINDNAVFCPICRKEQPHNDVKKISRIFCDACGTEIEGNDTSCPYCGKIMNLYKSSNYYKNNIPDVIKRVMVSILRDSIVWYIVAYIQITFGGMLLLVNIEHWRYLQSIVCLGIIAVGVLNIIYASRQLKYRRRIQTDYVGITYKARYSIYVIIMYILNVAIAVLFISTRLLIYILLFGGATIAALLFDSVGYRSTVKKNKDSLLILENFQSNTSS